MQNNSSIAPSKQDGDFARLIELLKGTRSGNQYQCRCPLHNDKTASLSIRVSGGKLLWNCFAGCDGRRLGRELRRIAGGALPSMPIDIPEEPNERKAEAIRRVWRQSKAVETSDPVHLYLTATRRLPLSAMPADLRYHPSLSLRTGELGKIDLGKHPAMVAAIRNLAGDLVQVHRTYLTNEGRKLSTAHPDLIADWDSRKLMPSPYTGCWKGGAIRLGNPTDTVVLAEGIETAIAAAHLSGFPAWACVTAGGLEVVELPESVRSVYIAVDNDPTGKNKSSVLAARLLKTGRKVFIVQAPAARKGADWADVVGVQ